MAMTDPELYEISERLAQAIFVRPNVTAHSNRDQLKAAVGAIDTAMNATGNQIVAAGYGTTQLEIALLTECQNAAPNLTVQQAGIAMAYWALKRVDLL